VTLLDANVILYSYNADAPEHERMRRWLEAIVGTGETVGIPWVSLWAFLRISTNIRALRRPFPFEEAIAIVKHLVSRPEITIVDPGPNHVDVLETVVRTSRISGPSMTDAALAAIAIEHNSALASADRGFARFRGLRWINPLEADA